MNINKDNKNSKKKICGKKCLRFSRVCGFYTPVENWNLGKESEFKDRKTYSQSKANQSIVNDIVEDELESKDDD